YPRLLTVLNGGRRGFCRAGRTVRNRSDRSRTAAGSVRPGLPAVAAVPTRRPHRTDSALPPLAHGTVVPLLRPANGAVSPAGPCFLPALRNRPARMDGSPNGTSARTPGAGSAASAC